jgi:hypothetical protein
LLLPAHYRLQRPPDSIRFRADAERLAGPIEQGLIEQQRFLSSADLGARHA